jgi:hypothetical protein
VQKNSSEVIERAERLCNRDRRVRLMELIEIDSIGSKPPQAVFRSPSDVFRAGALAFRIDAHAELRRDHHAVAASRQRMSKIDFAVRRTVDVGRVEEGDAGINGGMDDAHRLGFVDAHAEVIAAEADERDLERPDTARLHNG